MAAATLVTTPLPDPSLGFPEHPAQSSSCIDRISQYFNKVNEEFQKTTIGQLYSVYAPYQPLVAHAWNCVSYTVNARIFNVLLNLFWRTTTATGDGWQKYDHLFQAVCVCKIVAIVSVPFALYSATRNTYELVHGTEKLDAGLRLCEDISWICDSLTTFVTGLEMAGAAMAETAARVVFGLSAVSAIFAVGSLVLNGKHWTQNSEY